MSDDVINGAGCKEKRKGEGEKASGTRTDRKVCMYVCIRSGARTHRKVCMYVYMHVLGMAQKLFSYPL